MITDVTPARYGQICEAFEVAVDLSDQARDEFLHRISTDDASLRRDVEQMLLNDEEARKRAFLLMSTVPFSVEAAFHPGELIGDYELLELIGRGGMGLVYRAKQKSLDRIVALKTIRSGELASDLEVKRFQAEAKAAGNLDHPNIVSVYAVGESDGKHYFSMEYVEGPSLAEMLRANPLEFRKAVAYTAEVAEAVHFAHQRGVRHRDLKPSNVLIDRFDRVRVTDFGLSKRVESDDDITMTGQVMGTPSYMPPEQATGHHDRMDGRSDVYSLGAMLYELLTGRAPFRAESPVETLRQVIDLEPPSPRVLNPRIQRDPETICLKCLEKNPDHRYSTAQELADDLRRLLEGRPIHARPVNRLARVGRWVKRKPIAAAFIAATVLIGIGFPALVVSESARRTQARLRGQAENQRKLAEDSRRIAERESRRARAAENKATTLQNEDTYKTSIIAAQSHQWQTALARLDQVDAARLAQIDRFRLHRAKVLYALFRLNECISELDELIKTADIDLAGAGNQSRAQAARSVTTVSDSVRAQALVWRGAITLLHERKFEEGADLLRRALSLKLQDQDRFFARALLAETTDEAVSDLRKTILLDRYHQLANGMLVMSLMMLGEREEAAALAAQATVLFPADPNFPIIQLMIASLEGNKPGAVRLQAVLASRLDETAMPVLASISEALMTIPNSIAEWDHSSRQPVQSFVSLLLDFGRLRLRDSNLLAFRLPPILVTKVQPNLQTAALLMLIRNYDGASKALSRVAEANPEGFVHFLRAALLFQSGQWERAEAAASEAASLPAILPGVNHEARYFATMVAAGIYDRHRNPDDLIKAIAHLRLRAASGQLRHSHAVNLASVALVGEELEIARRLTTNVLDENPGHIAARVLLAKTLMKAGAYAEALKQVSPVLQQSPDDSDAMRIHNDALQHLRELIATSDIAE